MSKTKIFNLDEGDEYTIMGEKVTGVNKIVEHNLDFPNTDSKDANKELEQQLADIFWVFGRRGFTDQETVDDSVRKAMYQINSLMISKAEVLGALKDETQRWDEENGFCQNCDFARTDDSKKCLCIIRNQLRAEIATKLNLKPLLGDKE